MTAPSSLAKLPAQPHRTMPTSGTSGRVQKTRWSEREAKRARMDAMKAKEREMRATKEDAARTKREERTERKRKAEERTRLDQMAQKVCICWQLAAQWRGRRSVDRRRATPTLHVRLLKALSLSYSYFSTQMSAKKLDRKRRRMGLNKKVAH